MSNRMNITDEEIIAAVRSWEKPATPHMVHNRLLNKERAGLNEGYVLRRLRKLEKAGSVRWRFGWEIIEEPQP